MEYRTFWISPALVRGLSFLVPGYCGYDLYHKAPPPPDRGAAAWRGLGAWVLRGTGLVGRFRSSGVRMAAGSLGPGGFRQVLRETESERTLPAEQ